MKQDVGRPSLLDDDKFLLKIKNHVLDGKNEKEIQEILEIPKGTWEYWKWTNYQGFTDRLLQYKHERIIQKAEANLEVLLESEDERIVADMTKFSLEKLNKKHYSSRVEQTGKDGKELPTPIINLNIKEDVSRDNSTTEDTKTEEED